MKLTKLWWKIGYGMMLGSEKRQGLMIGQLNLEKSRINSREEYNLERTQEQVEINLGNISLLI